ncbi:acyl-CoA thioesterase [Cryptosporangium arvum]|uniref:Putative thioesterase n=1 Tax=Cryptosporangium arvum DSM 44712 TaxID=927661 RepID=A0A010ZXK4_9ACTN|nr:thioesterase family protein [Cryptosporangium arvum]EXG81952.1 putative thioesterase [Cryptosporangium arvum DSM 44712]
MFEWSTKVRYMECDAQGVVFNGWYLTYFDEAFAAFLTHRGLSYAELTGSGYDAAVVRTELDWKTGLGYGDEPAVAVSTATIGRTSFALDFEVRRDGEVTCSARTVYVVIATDGSGKREIPPRLAEALGDPAPLRG